MWIVSQVISRLAGIVRRVEVLAGPERRRRWSWEEKARILAESLAPDAVASAIARRHRLHLEPALRLAQGAEARRRRGGEVGGAVAPPASCRWRSRIGPLPGRGDRDRAGGRAGGVSSGDDPALLADVCDAESARMIVPPSGVRVLVATPPVDFRRRADGLAAIVQTVLGHDPFSGTIYVFRCQRDDRVKLLVWDGRGLVLMWKRLESLAFKWPPVTDGLMRLSAAQLAALLEGLDWSRMHVPRRGRPKTAQ